MDITDISISLMDITDVSISLMDITDISISLMDITDISISLLRPSVYQSSFTYLCFVHCVWAITIAYLGVG